MRPLLILLLVACTAPAAFSQNIPGNQAPATRDSFPKGLDKDKLSSLLLGKKLMPVAKRSLPMILLNNAPATTDKMPNGFTGEGPLFVYKGNNVYESTIDRMPVLVPAFTDNMPVKGKSANPPVLSPKG